MKRNRTPNNIHKVQGPNISDYSNQCSFSIEKEPVPTTIKVQFLLLLLVLLIQQYPLDSCTVKICSVGNFRNQLPFISKHIFIFRQTHSDFCFRRGGRISPVVRRKLTISALTWSGTSTCTQWLASGIRSSWSFGTQCFSSWARRMPK
jgi:hypothetical protein